MIDKRRAKTLKREGRACGARLFDQYDHRASEDEAAIDQLCADPKGTLEILVVSLHASIALEVWRGRTPSEIKIYDAAAESELRRRFAGMVARLGDALRVKLEELDPELHAAFMRQHYPESDA